MAAKIVKSVPLKRRRPVEQHGAGGRVRAANGKSAEGGIQRKVHENAQKDQRQPRY